jgi:hypothetical protein
VGLFAPWFLAGLAALSIPLWLHLLRRHRADPRRFSSLMFFEKRTQSSVRHKRLHFLMLWGLRTALVFLLALLFAEPYINRPAEKVASDGRLVVFAVDNSFSMRMGGRLDNAKQQALQAVAELRPGSRAQVMALSSQANVLTQQEQDQAALRAAVASIEPSDSRSSFGELARAVRALSESSRMPLEVHLFSDMQNTSLPPGFGDLRLPAGTELVTHSVGGSVAGNWAIENVTAPRRLYGGRKLPVQATVAGYGAPAAPKRISLSVNGRVVETKTIEVPESGRATVSFSPVEATYGLNKGEVRVEGGDSFDSDDAFYFSVERSEPQRVLFIHDERDRRSLLYFQVALESGTDSAFSVEPVNVGNAQASSFNRYAFVVLADLGSLPGGLESSLEKFVKDGGSVWVTLGPNAAARSRVPVTGQRLQEGLSAREAERFQSVSFADTTHAAFRRANRWEGVRFFRPVRVDPADTRVVARLNDDTPVLMEKNIGDGRVLVFASTFDNVSNDFPIRAAFVPHVEQTAFYLSGADHSQASVMVDAFIGLRSEREKGEGVEVIGPDGGRALSLAESASASDYQVTRAGFYEVRRSNGRKELVAVNADRRESDFAMVPDETLTLWRNTGQGTAAAVDGGSGEFRKVSLWWMVLLALLAVTLAQYVVANRYLHTQRETA